jgi:hypothetical protein
VVVLAAVAGVAAAAVEVAVVLAVVAAVVLAVVAAVVLAAVAAVVLAAVAAVVPAVVAAVAVVAATLPADELFAAPAAMQPVINAAVAKPATPVTRRALRAGCGLRRRARRGASRFARMSVWVFIEVFLSGRSSAVEVMHSSSITSLGGPSEHALLLR